MPERRPGLEITSAHAVRRITMHPAMSRSSARAGESQERLAARPATGAFLGAARSAAPNGYVHASTTDRSHTR
jgi:hypothetical protein